MSNVESEKRYISTGEPVSQDTMAKIQELEHEGATITVAEVTVSASEKVSTGQYENYNPHTTLKGSVILEGPWEDHKESLESQLLDIHKSVQKTLQRACDNKIAVEEHEDWEQESL